VIGQLPEEEKYIKYKDASFPLAGLYSEVNETVHINVKTST
jgi:hypothetical protein